MELFDLTPDPKVLIVLTRTNMQPLDALCELIDNAIDSFQVASLQGLEIRQPTILVDLPRPSDVAKGAGAVRVRDNGPGMNREVAERSIRAGFSGNNPYDSLGLFGMGFNISTGKLGRVTTMYTACPGEPVAISVTIDLEAIRKAGHYKVPFTHVDRRPGFAHGTEIAVNQWWPEGDANNGFIKRLASYPLSTVRAELGRRYSTLLRERKFRLMVNGDPCEPFEHCVWADHRTVKRNRYGEIPAVYRFNEIIGNQKRCTMCTALVLPEHQNCPACGNGSVRTISERIRGWVGIQRFDHPTDFGVDLIRNGRAIRVWEKSAFFEFTDEFRKVVKDYPIDSPYGRIVGEVHLDHVPVDFMKQDFQRQSPEWQRAVAYLRGNTSLQPGRAGDEPNQSPVFMLYQGYRRVRTPGRTDMYVGRWDPVKEQPARFENRDIEEEYYEKFRKRIPGFYDDTEWWKLVEKADERPATDMAECPACGFQDLAERDLCEGCGHVLKGKPCLNPECGQEIPVSALSCPACGLSQVPEVDEPWRCQICNMRNATDRSTCDSCGSVRHAENTLSRDYLLRHSRRSDELSIPACSVLLADGSYSAPIDVITYVTEGPIRLMSSQQGIPVLALRDQQTEIFVDLSHPLFRSLQVPAEHLIAAEVAVSLFDMNRRLTVAQYHGRHTISNLVYAVLQSRWADRLDVGSGHLQEEVRAFFDVLKSHLPDLASEVAAEAFDVMTDDQIKHLMENLINAGQDISRIADMKMSGEYLRYIDADAAVGIIRRWPERFFGGRLFTEAYPDAGTLRSSVLLHARERVVAPYLNCLEDLAGLVRYRHTDQGGLQRARLSLEFLQKKLV